MSSKYRGVFDAIPDDRTKAWHKLGDTPNTEETVVKSVLSRNLGISKDHDWYFTRKPGRTNVAGKNAKVYQVAVVYDMGMLLIDVVLHYGKSAYWEMGKAVEKSFYTRTTWFNMQCSKSSDAPTMSGIMIKWDLGEVHSADGSFPFTNAKAVKDAVNSILFNVVADDHLHIHPPYFGTDGVSWEVDYGLFKVTYAYFKEGYTSTGLATYDPLTEYKGYIYAWDIQWASRSNGRLINAGSAIESLCLMVYIQQFADGPTQAMFRGASPMDFRRDIIIDNSAMSFPDFSKVLEAHRRMNGKIDTN